MIEIVPYDPAWPERFAQLGGELRGALGGVALRIDHIGSTAVPGLAGKPVVDVQISVAAFEPLDAFRQPSSGLATSTARITPSGRSATSASRPARRGPMSTSAGREASPSSSPCSFATSCAPPRRSRPSTRRSSAASPSAIGTSATCTPRPRCRSSGRSSAGPTRGRRRAVGAPDPATPEHGPGQLLERRDRPERELRPAVHATSMPLRRQGSVDGCCAAV
jgi:hypothetical protein